VTNARGVAAALAMSIAVAAGCTGSAPAGGQNVPGGGAQALPTPQLGLSPQLAQTAAALRAHLGPSYPLVQLTGSYRPSEPEPLQLVPRAVFQIDLGTPRENHVVIYQLVDSAMAAARGRDLAAYLASGFGQTNFPADAQFVLAQFGDTLVLGWWSPARSSSQEQVRAAFERLRAFGQPIPVPK
jgi:hypothetical protein